jgi:tetratricopeptide (TPR) repeat protein
MPVVYQAKFYYTQKKEKEVFALTRILPDGTQDTSPLNIDEIHQLEDQTRDFKWNKSLVTSRQIGEQLFTLLNGDRQTLLRALKEANEYDETLQLIVKAEGPASNLPFELIHHNDFLVPSQIHLIRRVSDRGIKTRPEPEDRPLKILFMACSPLDTYPVLAFEKEEDTIFEVTKDLPVEIDVEDTGSLEGLGEWLDTNEYDVVHIVGHADIDKEGTPIFWMEDDEGLSVQVKPAQLWKTLSLNLPKLVFLSGCRTGEAPEHAAAMSFAHHLVSGHVSTVLGWGLPVSDVGASVAAKTLYHDLSRGKNILDAVLRTRYVLYNPYPTDWSLLRLFSDGSPLHVPLVAKGQKKLPKPRELLYTFLENSQVKVLRKGFIGRRRQIQLGLRCLRSDSEKIGLLLHGTGGLGKSCLAGKFCDHFKDHTLIIVHGYLNAVTFHEALKDAFIRADDYEGLKRLEAQEEMPDKIRGLCSSAFQKRNYLILLDDFEKNMPEREEGILDLSPDSVPILEALLNYLPYSVKKTRLITTSRHTFSLTFDGKDLVSERLEPIGLTSFRDADERKKIAELEYIAKYKDPEIKQQLIETGRGNPRLMEALNSLVGGVRDVTSILSAAKGKQEEFVQELVLSQLLESQPEAFQTFLRRSAVYRLPVHKDGIGSVSEGLTDWESAAENAVRLSLMEKDRTRNVRYWVSPLLRDDIFAELQAEEQKQCHKVAASYYLDLLQDSADLYDPVSGSELIEHALKSGQDDIAIEEGGARFLPYLRNTLAYREALTQGDKILSHIVEPKSDDKYGKFMYELGWVYYDTGDARQAIEYYEQALSIGKEVYGERHPNVATTLNNIGGAWDSLGEPKKALEYYEQALAIDKEVYGDKHPSVAATLNNIGSAWDALGEPKKAIGYYEQALSIGKEVYGERHPNVATTLNNIGVAWSVLGASKKALEYYEQALSIDKEVYGERHPSVAETLNNIGSAWDALGEPKKALEYYEQALSIGKEVYGSRHPSIATRLNNIGGAWDALGEPKKALEYYKQALAIDKEVYGERHPNVATRLSNIGGAWYALGEPKKALEYYEQALAIDKEVYGDRHPSVAIRLNNIGMAWDALGEQEKALEYYEEALSIDKGVYGDQHPIVASILNNLGSTWDRLGDPKKAIEFYEQALSIDKGVYGDRHPSVARTLNNLGGEWITLGDQRRAIEYLEEALSIDQEIYGDIHPNVATDLSNLGLAWSTIEDQKKAIEYFSEALNIFIELESWQSIVDMTQRLELSYKSEGNVKELIKMYEKIWNICKDKEVKKEPKKWQQQKANLGYSLGRLLLKEGRWKDALRIQQIVKKKYKEIRDATGMANACKELGVIYELFNDYEAARWSYKDALRIYKLANNTHGRAITEVNLGRLEIKTGLIFDAVKHLKDAVSYFINSNDTKNIKLVNQLLDLTNKLQPG